MASVVIQGPLSIGIALLLNRKFFGRGFLRTVIFAPYVLPPAVTGVMWSLILQPGGFADQVLKAFGLGGLVQLWLANLHVVLYTVFAVLTWKYIGFGIILLLAGLQGVPRELKQAAAIDGASPWQVTRRVTLPLLAPTIRIWGFITVIGSLQIFDVVWILTQGGPANASGTISTYMYRTGFQNEAFSFAHGDCDHHVRLLLRVRALLPAVRAAPRHPRRADQGGGTMAAITAAPPAGCARQAAAVKQVDDHA